MIAQPRVSGWAISFLQLCYIFKHGFLGNHIGVQLLALLQALQILGNRNTGQLCQPVHLLPLVGKLAFFQSSQHSSGEL